jgi:CBS domain-containing protein
MRVGEVMTRDVTTVTPETPVREIARLMVEQRVSALPVVDAAGRLVGLVSEGDLLQRAETGTEGRRSWWLDLFADPDARAASFLKAHGRTAAEVMVERLEVAQPDTPLDVAARLMHERRVKRLPVVENGRLVGIIARADLLRALLQAPEPKPVAQVDDLAIKDRFEATAKAAGFTGVGSVTIVVEDGMVQLWGLASTATERRALELAAAEIPGVRGVENNLAVRDELPAGP